MSALSNPQSSYFTKGYFFLFHQGLLLVVVGAPSTDGRPCSSTRICGVGIGRRAFEDLKPPKPNTPLRRFGTTLRGRTVQDDRAIWRPRRLAKKRKIKVQLLQQMLLEQQVQAVEAVDHEIGFHGFLVGVLKDTKLMSYKRSSVRLTRSQISSGNCNSFSQPRLRDSRYFNRPNPNHNPMFLRKLGLHPNSSNRASGLVASLPPTLYRM